MSADLYLLGPACYQQAPWLQIGLVEAVRYSKRTNTDQNQKHIKMSPNIATSVPSPQVWQSGTKEGNQDVPSISCLWLLAEGKSERPALWLEAFTPLRVQPPARRIEALKAQLTADPEVQ